MTLGMPVQSVPVTGVLAPNYAPLSPAQMQAETMLHDEARALAERVAAVLPAELCPEACSRQGSPAEEILEEARVWPADLIVLGSHGHGGLRSLVLGSVASRVMHHAQCSVEVVRART
jgi:nucleotide-binding universal stress UspA family protein